MDPVLLAMVVVLLLMLLRSEKRRLGWKFGNFVEMFKEIAEWFNK